MIRKCKECAEIYNDANQLTICPHDSLAGEKYCKYHDLFNCVICAREDEISQEMQKEDITERAA